MKEFKTIAEFLKVFGDEEACRKHFENIRFGKGDFCPHCKHDKIMRFSDGKRYRCHNCRQDFTIKTGTLFGESKICFGITKTESVKISLQRSKSHFIYGIYYDTKPERILDFDKINERRIAVGLSTWELQQKMYEIMKKKFGW